MKCFFIFSFILLLTGSTYSQGVCSFAGKIESPAVVKPSAVAVASANCTSITITWKGERGQDYAIQASYAGSSGGQKLIAAPAAISCDEVGNCRATIPVPAGSAVSWSIQASSVINNRIFHSYALNSTGDFLVPDCGTVITSEPNRAVSGEEHALNQENLVLFPNPVSKLLSVKWSGGYLGDATIEIIDEAGKLVQSYKINKGQKDFSRTINIGSLTVAVYTLIIKKEHGSAVVARFVRN